MNATDERTAIPSRTRARLWQLAGPWWTFLLTGQWLTLSGPARRPRGDAADEAGPEARVDAATLRLRVLGAAELEGDHDLRDAAEHGEEADPDQQQRSS